MIGLLLTGGPVVTMDPDRRIYRTVPSPWTAGAESPSASPTTWRARPGPGGVAQTDRAGRAPAPPPRARLGQAPPGARRPDRAALVAPTRFPQRSASTPTA